MKTPKKTSAGQDKRVTAYNGDGFGWSHPPREIEEARRCGKAQILRYLVEIAGRTKGARAWGALFEEMLMRVEGRGR